MKISKVTVYPYESKKKNETLKAFVNVELDECFVVTGIKVVDGAKGLFISMPSNKGKDDEYHDVCFPVTKDFREELTTKVIKAYNKKIDD